MGFQATNYTVSLLLLMAFTVGMMIVRGSKPLDNNWPMYYWVLMVAVTLRWPAETWDFRAVLMGAAAGFMLRFEFMSQFFARLVRVVEFAAWIYILYAGMQRIFL